MVLAITLDYRHLQTLEPYNPIGEAIFAVHIASVYPGSLATLFTIGPLHLRADM